MTSTICFNILIARRRVLAFVGLSDKTDCSQCLNLLLVHSCFLLPLPILVSRSFKLVRHSCTRRHWKIRKFTVRAAWHRVGAPYTSEFWLAGEIKRLEVIIYFYDRHGIIILL